MIKYWFQAKNDYRFFFWHMLIESLFICIFNQIEEKFLLVKGITKMNGDDQEEKIQQKDNVLIS